MRVLRIDLGEQSAEVEEREELFRRYLGGSGVAAKLLLEHCPRGCDAFSPENPVILAVGPLTAAFPACSKAVAMFKSPLTGELGESHAGGRLGAAIRFAGYGAIVVKGRAEHPVYVSIRDGDVGFRDARSIWGISSAYTVGKILRRVEPAPGRRSIIRIGPAGEKLVAYANVNVDTYRHFGRLGLGAVFGSKNLKAMVISGSRGIDIPDRERYLAAYREIYDAVVNTESLKKYHDFGTAINVNPLNQLKALPTRNLRSSSFEDAEHISGEHFAEAFLSRRAACTACPVGCIHIAALQIPFSRGFEYETKLIPYDYELIYALGSLLGVPMGEGVLHLIEEVDHLGLDAITTGVVLAWATEAYEERLISKRDTLGVELSWGEVEAYSEAVRNLVAQPNEFYNALARGVVYAAGKYGGEDFALALGGLEIAGYHTGRANIAGHIASPRHGHLDNAGYSLDQKILKKEVPPARVAEQLLAEDYWRCFVNSLVICLFARGVYTEERVEKALNAVGVSREPWEFWEIGREIFKLKYEFKLREGFSLDLEAARIPGRFYETESSQGYVKKGEIQELLRIYKEKIKELFKGEKPS